MQDLDTLCRLVLGLTYAPLVCFFGIVFCWWNLKKGGSVVFLLLFTMIFNPFLKSIWQVSPLPSVGSDSWAFPSGHMQAACVFYGWMAWQVRYLWFRSMIILLLGGIGGSLIYCGYHTLADVVAGAFFAGLSMVLYHHILVYPWVNARLPWVGVFMMPLTFLLIAFYPRPLTFFMGLAQAGLLVFSLLWIVFQKFWLRRPSVLIEKP